jgi:protein-tyrosine phosphatase
MIVFFVNERLAFGSKVRLKRHVQKLQSLGITHVIDVRYYPGKKLRKFETIHLNFRDDARPRPMWFYARAWKFYSSALKQSQPKVFVMCRAGRRRSASLTYFLLRASGVTKRMAEEKIMRARPCAQIVRSYRDSGEQFLRQKSNNSKLKPKAVAVASRI